MRLKPVLAFAALILTALALSACSANSPLSGGPGPLPNRAGPLTNNQGNEAFNSDDYDAALSAYALADEKMPERPEPEYNSGNALYRMDSLEEAQARYQGALALAEDDQLSRNSVFNIGNVLYTSEQYAGAAEAYKEALRIDPTDLDAKYNLELALEQLRQEEQQAQSDQLDPGDQGEEEEDEEGQEQQNQPGDQGQEEEDQQEQNSPSDQTEPSGSEQDSDEELQPVPIEALTEEQARQLLQSVGENTETLQSRIQRVLVTSGPPPERNW